MFKSPCRGIRSTITVCFILLIHRLSECHGPTKLQVLVAGAWWLVSGGGGRGGGDGIAKL